MDPLYLTSFVLRALYPTYVMQIKGVGGRAEINPKREDAGKEVQKLVDGA